MGSKNRISEELLPIITKHLTADMYYVEPFVGGANMIDKVKHDKRIGADANEHLILLWKALQNGYVPPDCISENRYKRYNKYRFLHPLTAYIGFFARGKGHSGQSRNYVKERKNNIFNNQIHLINNINFIHTKYDELVISGKSVIYCDPPYEGTTKYKSVIDHNHFWEWCRNKTLEGHIVYVSEYNAPDDFEEIYNKELAVHVGHNNNSKPGKKFEKLFMYKPQYLELRKQDRLERYLQRNHL